MIVYKTTNIINGKIYVGRQLHDNSNYIGSGKIMRRAIEKYGKSNFKKEILEQCPSIEILNEREKYWISFFNSTDKNIGYNIMEGGQGGNHHNYKHGIEHHSYGKSPPIHVRLAVSQANRQRVKVFGEMNKSYKKTDDTIKQLILQLASDGFGRDKIYTTITQMGLLCPPPRTIARRLNEWTSI